MVAMALAVTEGCRVKVLVTEGPMRTAVGVQRGDGHGGVGVTGEVLGVDDAEHVKAGLFCGDGMIGDFVGSELSAPGYAEVHFHGCVLRWGGVSVGIIAYGGWGDLVDI